MKPVGIIYKIQCKDNDTLFIGSTKNTERYEAYRHKHHCDNGHLFLCKYYTHTSYNWYNNLDNRMYKYIRANGGWDNWQFIVIEEFYCGEEMKKRQHYHFNKDL